MIKLKEAILLPVNPPQLSQDEQKIVNAYRWAKVNDFTDIEVKIQDGNPVFLSVTSKVKSIDLR